MKWAGVRMVEDGEQGEKEDMGIVECREEQEVGGIRWGGMENKVV